MAVAKAKARFRYFVEPFAQVESMRERVRERGTREFYRGKKKVAVKKRSDFELGARRP